MEIPENLRREIQAAITARLAAVMGDRGLLLPPDRLAAADRRARHDGEQLLTSVIHQCYPLSKFDTQAVFVEFDNERAASHVRSTLAFGAVTASLLTPDLCGPRTESIRLLGGIFNLGIGLIDSISDADVDQGSRLLELFHRGDVADAATRPRPRGWLRMTLPDDLESDPAVVFAVDIVEAFFDTIHATFPGEPWLPLRGRIGHQLAAALDAERWSIAPSRGNASSQQLARCSHDTSVLPFEIVGTLAGHTAGAASNLGEAMWRIDDLVDLCDDARTGALNSLMLAASANDSRALEDMLASGRIDRVATEAGDALGSGDGTAEGRRSKRPSRRVPADRGPLRRSRPDLALTVRHGIHPGVLHDAHQVQVLDGAFAHSRYEQRADTRLPGELRRELTEAKALHQRPGERKRLARHQRNHVVGGVERQQIGLQGHELLGVVAVGGTRGVSGDRWLPDHAVDIVLDRTASQQKISGLVHLDAVVGDVRPEIHN